MADPSPDSSTADPSPGSSPPDPLAAAYLATDYRVCSSPLGPFVIRCGEHSPLATALVARESVGQWAFITAENPGSGLLAREANAERMRQLQAVVEAAGYTHHPGLGQGPGDDWPPEASLLVLGIAEAEAVSLGRRFGQRAIVTGRRDGPARLVWLED
jgi:hypothetical protein